MIIDQLTENKAIAKQYKELLRISYQTLSETDKKIIRLAFDMAVEAHSNQRRKSGEAYIFHPINVAKIVAEQIGLDATSICAALLHDVVEDTKFSIEDIERNIGTDVAKIVHGLTKISSLKKDKNISLQAENFRKMLLTLNDDVRVIIIKIADRLHNMQTMDAMPEHKQVKIASETLYIYAPLAHRIGLYNVKTELEDLSLKYTEPKRYESIKLKIEETIKYGGDQLLLQGGHHPKLGLKFYTQLFKDLKSLYPNIKLHALGPPEIAHICKIGDYTHLEVLKELKKAGMDSMPGAGAEILSDRVRRWISKGKCSGQEWLDIMQVAHSIGLTTSATMMFGHIENIYERLDHLVRIREVQSKKSSKENGFLAFIAWPFMDDGTLLQRVKGINNNVTADEYLRMVAICRIMLPNIKNIQTSWLTVGAETAQLTLHGGANDMGSIMIEENVVSAAGAPHRFTAKSIQSCIKDAGFIPKLRNQLYEFRETPDMVEQEINY